jgi:hypothetical protein
MSSVEILERGIERIYGKKEKEMEDLGGGLGFN